MLKSKLKNKSHYLMGYTPSKKILKNYANVLVNFALGHGKGIKKGDVVNLVIGEEAKPLLGELRKAVWKAGGHLILRYLPSEDDRYMLAKDFYQIARDEQLSFFPKKYYKGLIDEMDHQLMILSEVDPQALKGISAEKIMKNYASWKPYKEWRFEKENKGKFSWTLGLYGTKEMAKEAGMSEKEYWGEIIKACFLDKKDPISEWKKVFREIEKYKKKLTALNIEKVHIEGPDIDLNIKIGKDRQWVGGGGANIPSFEIFTSPDWRGTEGWIKFNVPLYYSGNIVTGIELEFKNGKLTRAKAKKNEKLLKEMIANKDADKVGEFSLTDKRHSRITKFMAQTLYDENIGGPNGNTHIALGSSYAETYKGRPASLTKVKKKKLGFNDSVVHTDMFSTAPRTVTAYLSNGKKKVIYKDGMFKV